MCQPSAVTVDELQSKTLIYITTPYCQISTSLIYLRGSNLFEQAQEFLQDRWFGLTSVNFTTVRVRSVVLN